MDNRIRRLTAYISACSSPMFGCAASTGRITHSSLKPHIEDTSDRSMESKITPQDDKSVKSCTEMKTRDRKQKSQRNPAFSIAARPLDILAKDLRLCLQQTPPTRAELKDNSAGSVESVTCFSTIRTQKDSVFNLNFCPTFGLSQEMKMQSRAVNRKKLFTLNLTLCKMQRKRQETEFQESTKHSGSSQLGRFSVSSSGLSCRDLIHLTNASSAFSENRDNTRKGETGKIGWGRVRRNGITHTSDTAEADYCHILSWKEDNGSERREAKTGKYVLRSQTSSANLVDAQALGILRTQDRPRLGPSENNSCTRGPALTSDLRCTTMAAAGLCAKQLSHFSK